MTNATNTTGNTASNTVESNDLANRTVAELGIPAGATRDQALAALREQIMGAYSGSDREGPLAGAVERFLRRQPHLARRSG